MTVALFLSTIKYERKDYAGRGRGWSDVETRIVWAEDETQAARTHLDSVQAKHSGWTIEVRDHDVTAALVSSSSDETSATN